MWLWLAWQAMKECDDLVYAYPRPEGWEAACERLEAQVEACVGRAEQIAPGCTEGPVWTWAAETFGDPEPSDVPGEAQESALDSPSVTPS